MARKETNFKQTDIGLIPHDWEVEEIIDIASISTGGQNTQDAKDGGLYPFYVRSPKVERINSYLYDTEGVVTAGDGVGVGKVFHYVNGKFGLHQRCYLIHRFKGVWAKYFYMYFSLQFYNRVMSMTAKSSVDSVRRDMIAHMLIPLPPIEEQKRIAEVLSHFDEHIDNLAALLEKRKQVKAATMHALLSGTTRLPGFTAPWGKRTIEQISNRYDNLRIPVAENLRVKGCTPYYGANGIQGYVQGYTHDGEFVLIAEDGASDLSNYPTQYVIGKIWVNNHAHVLQGKSGQCSNCFLCYALKTPKYKEIVVGGERAKLNAKNLMEIELFIPTILKEQEAIADILSNMDRGIEALEEQIEKYRQMKEGAMEELLTGKVRLI